MRELNVVVAAAERISSSIRKQVFDVAAFLALIGLALVPLATAPARVAAGAAALVVGLVGWHRHRRVAAVLIVAGVALVVLGSPPPIGGWPKTFLMPLIVLAALAAFTRLPVADAFGATRGRFGRREVLFGVAFVLLPAAALLSWAMVFHPDLSRLRAMVPPVAPILLVPLALLFAVSNAIIEELVWRGVLLRWLRGIIPVSAAVAVQAVSFGAAHWTGVPSGWDGVVLASVYGLMMGTLAVLADGLLAPIVAHCCADLVIFALILGVS